MTRKKLLAAVALCALLCLCVGLVNGSVYAQADNDAAKRVDKDIANKRGVAESLAPVKKKGDGEGGTTKTQMAIGFGSIIVMIIVVKWL